MKHAYQAAGPGMLLRPLAGEDIESLRQWRNDPANTAFLRPLPYITPEAQTQWFGSYLENPDEAAFAIVETGENSRLVGSVSLYHFSGGEAEFGRLLVGEPAAHGRGTGKRAMRLLLQIGFEQMGLSRIYGHVHPANIAARRVYAAAGMTETGERAGEEFVTALTRADWRAGQRNGDMEVRLVEFQQRGDERGQLVIAEGEKNIPFAIRRVFWMFGTEGDAVRGQHANRRSAFVLVCAQGSCRVRARDGRGYDGSFLLDRPELGLYLPPMIWKDMYDFSPDAVLLCLSSEAYDAGEYLRDYDAYQSEVNA